MNIKDFDFKPKCTPEHIAVAKKWLEEHHETFSGTTNFCKVFEDLTYKSLKMQACHAAIGNSETTEISLVVTDCGNERAERSNPIVVEPFLKWFAQESYFSPFILNNDDFDEMFNRGFIISADIPAPLLQNICIITRHFFEVADFGFELFNMLTEKHGVPGIFAYHMALNSNFSGSGANKKGQLYSYNAGHRAWTLPKTLPDLKNLLVGDFGGQFKKDCNEKRHYRHYQTIYGGALYGVSRSMSETFISEMLTGSSAHKELVDRLRTFRKEDDKPVEVSNPFKRVFPGHGLLPSRMNIEEVTNVLIPHMKEQGIFDNVSA